MYIHTYTRNYIHIYLLEQQYYKSNKNEEYSYSTIHTQIMFKSSHVKCVPTLNASIGQVLKKVTIKNPLGEVVKKPTTVGCFFQVDSAPHTYTRSRERTQEDPY